MIYSSLTPLWRCSCGALPLVFFLVAFWKPTESRFLFPRGPSESWRNKWFFGGPSENYSRFFSFSWPSEIFFVCSWVFFAPRLFCSMLFKCNWNQLWVLGPKYYLFTGWSNIDVAASPTLWTCTSVVRRLRRCVASSPDAAPNPQRHTHPQVVTALHGLAARHPPPAARSKKTHGKKNVHQLSEGHHQKKKHDFNQLSKCGVLERHVYGQQKPLRVSPNRTPTGPSDTEMWTKSTSEPPGMNRAEAHPKTWTMSSLFCWQYCVFFFLRGLLKADRNLVFFFFLCVCFFHGFW